MAAEAARKDVCVRLAPLEGEPLRRAALAMCRVHAVEVPDAELLSHFSGSAAAVVGADEEEGAGALQEVALKFAWVHQKKEDVDT
jgi:hypothetical protein